MYNAELQSYVTSSRASGVADEQIKNNLLASGWPEADILAALAGTAVPTPNTGLEVSSAGLRLANYILDGIFVYVLQIILVFVIAMLMPPDDEPGFFILGAYLMFFMTALGYYLLFEGVWQKTPAKFITKTKVVMRDGSKPDFLHILGRTFARLIPFEPLSFLNGAPGWHDTLSKTLVVPKGYTAEQVQQINLTKKSKNGWIIALVVGFIGIAVIGILAAVVLVSLNSARVKSRDAMRENDVRSIQTFLEIYYTDYQAYPYNLSDLAAQGLMVEVPVAPIPPDGSCTAEMNEYNYTSDGSNYMLSFCLGEATGGFEAGVNTVSSDYTLDNFTN